jgi:hypothetical protein
MKCEDAYVFKVSNEEAEVIKQFVSAMESISIGIDNDDIWEIMEAIANKQTSSNITGIMIMYEEGEDL